MYSIFLIDYNRIVIALSLREYQQQNYRPIKPIKIVSLLMSVRLIISLCGIFVAVFHFRRLKQIQLDRKNQQRMLDRLLHLVNVHGHDLQLF